MPAGFCTKVTSFLCLLLILLAFLVSLSHTDTHQAVPSGGHSIDAGSMVPASLGICPAAQPLSVGTGEKRSVTLDMHWFCGPAVECEDTLGHGMECGQPCRLQERVTNSNDPGRGTTASFSLAQVKCPNHAALAQGCQPENGIIYTHACGWHQMTTVCSRFIRCSINGAHFQGLQSRRKYSP